MALKVTGPPNTLLYIEEMINRILIRIKVVQILYAFVNTKPEATLARAQRDLKTSLEQTYAVYNRLLALTIALTDMQDRRLDDARNRYMPSEEDLNPNTRFIDNRMVAALRADEKLQQYISDNHINWDDQFIYLRATLDRILKSDIYLTYMDDSADDLQHDCELWRQLMRKVILPDPELLEVLQSISLYITEEDVDIMGQFVVKTMRRIAQGKDDIILPPFNDEVRLEICIDLARRGRAPVGRQQCAHRLARCRRALGQRAHRHDGPHHHGHGAGRGALLREHPHHRDHQRVR